MFPVDFDQYGSPNSLRNIIIIATDAPALPADEILRRARGLAAERIVTVDRFVDAAGTLYQAPIRMDDVPVLSDDFAPVDALIPTR